MSSKLPPIRGPKEPQTYRAPMTPQPVRFFPDDNINPGNDSLFQTQQPYYSPPISPRRLDPRLFGLSSGRIRPAREKWSNLSGQLEDFTKLCRLDSAIPSFMEQYWFVNRYFTQFNQYAIHIFNSIHPTDYPRSHMSKAAIHQSGRLLILEWARFLDMFYKLSMSKMGPVFPVVLKKLENVEKNVEKVADLFLVGTLKSDIKPSMMNRIYKEIDLLIKQVRKRIIDEDEELFIDFDLDAFAKRVNRLTNAIQSMFKRAMPKHTTMSGEVMVDKMNLNVALNELIDIMTGISNFDNLCSSIKYSIIEMDNEFQDLFKTLQLKYDLVINEDCKVLQEPEKPKVATPPQPYSARAPRKQTIS